MAVSVPPQDIWQSQSELRMGDFSRSKADLTLLIWGVRIPWVLDWALKYGPLFLFNLCFSVSEDNTFLLIEDTIKYE